MLEPAVIPLVGEKIFMNSGELIAQAAKHCKARVQPCHCSLEHNVWLKYMSYGSLRYHEP